MSDPTFFWHDYETTGADTRRDRPSQFAGVRTNFELEPVAEPVVAFCKPATDVLPHPEAILLTGITPQRAERDGIRESEFAALVHEQLAVPGTCGAGFNSIRFDDEITRHLLYRNFYDPYAREWENGNSRWDLIDLARICYALRPDGIEWPRRAEGAPSFRLGDLAVANHLVHSQAHDALSDVEATLALARMLRARQRKLFDWYLGLRAKRRALEYLDWTTREPVLHVSSRYPAERGCIAIVMPLAALPDQPNAVIVYDLAADPTELLALDPEALRERVFTPRNDLPEDVARIPLKLVRANRCPALAPLTVLKGVDLARIALDPERCLAHAARLKADDFIASKVRAVFARDDTGAVAEDADLALYSGGFLPDADRAMLARVRRASPAELANDSFRFRDPRYRELLFRYRARNWPESLSHGERERWQQFRTRRLERDDGSSALTLEGYRALIAQLRQAHALDPAKQGLLDALEGWGNHVSTTV